MKIFWAPSTASRQAKFVPLMRQKAIPGGGYVAAGIYHGGNETLFTNSEGHVVQTGGCSASSLPTSRSAFPWAGSDFRESPRRVTSMMDLVFVGVTLLFFLASWLYVRACDRV